MKGILGYKIGMTRVFDETGVVTPVSVVSLDENMAVVGLKTEEKNGYNAIQIGIGKKKKPNKSEEGSFKNKKMNVPLFIREFRVSDISNYKVGDKINGSFLTEMKYLDVSGVSKGKGFQGVFKRYSFHGGPKTHGSHSHRSPGSIGTASMARVYKGRKMPGRMGNDNVTVQNLEVVKNDIENRLILIKGNIPGKNGGLVFLKQSVKKGVAK